jgi:Fe-S-cluster-containing hydrogenase component 2
MKVPLLFNNETCSGCKICQLACALVNYQETNPAKALLNVYGKFPAPGKYYIDYCDQCGKCAVACPVKAIHAENGVYLINTSECISCGVCLKTCPRKVMRMFDNLPHKCTDCGECAAICPRDAIRYSSEEASA